MNEFENKLQRQPVREVPAHWRTEILGMARAAALHSSVPKARHWLDDLWQLFWPCPQAWAGLAAVWALSIVLHLCTPPRADLMAGQPSPVRPADSGAFVESRKMLAQVLELPTPPTPAAGPPKPSVPGPRSERKHESCVG